MTHGSIFVETWACVSIAGPWWYIYIWRHCRSCWAHNDISVPILVSTLSVAAADTPNTKHCSLNSALNWNVHIHTYKRICTNTQTHIKTQTQTHTYTDRHIHTHIQKNTHTWCVSHTHTYMRCILHCKEMTSIVRARSGCQFESTSLPPPRVPSSTLPCSLLLYRVPSSGRLKVRESGN